MATSTSLLATPPPLANPPDCLALAAPLWAVHVELYGSNRVLRPLMRKNDDELGLVLTQVQAVLAIPGRNGRFNQWLRQQRIVRATAYRLIQRYAKRLNPKPVTDLKRLTATVPRFQKATGPAPLFTLRNGVLTMKLDHRLEHVFRQSLYYLTGPSARPLNIPESFCGFLARLAPRDIAARILAAWQLPVHHFNSSEYRNLEDIVALPGDPGAILCN